MLSPDRQEEFFQRANNYGSLEYDCPLVWRKHGDTTWLVELHDTDFENEPITKCRVTFLDTPYKGSEMMAVDIHEDEHKSSVDDGIIVMNCVPQALFALLYA